MSVAEIAIYIFYFYLALGFVFSLLFIWKGATTLDNDVAESPKTFRMLLIPEAIALWPILLLKWVRK